MEKNKQINTTETVAVIAGAALIAVAAAKIIKYFWRKPQPEPDTETETKHPESVSGLHGQKAIPITRAYNKADLKAHTTQQDNDVIQLDEFRIPAKLLKGSRKRGMSCPGIIKSMTENDLLFLTKKGDAIALTLNDFKAQIHA